MTQIDKIFVGAKAGLEYDPEAPLRLMNRSRPGMFDYLESLKIKSEAEGCFRDIKVSGIKLSKTIFFPEETWIEAVERFYSADKIKSCELLGLTSVIYPWRFTKSIYRLDYSVLRSLISSKLPSKIPVESIVRVSEWTSYIDLNHDEDVSLTVDAISVKGFWVAWSHHAQYGFVLKFVLNMGGDKVKYHPIFLGQMQNHGTIDIEKIFLNIKKEKDLLLLYNALLSIFMYICNSEPEIFDPTQPEYVPMGATPKKTKKGLRLFPAKKLKIISMGAKMGKLIRKSTEYKGDGLSRKVSPHIRKGHWHGYWTGPRNGDQVLKMKWVPLTMVRGSDEMETSKK